MNCWAACCRSVKVLSLCTSRSACTQHSACRSSTNWPASSDRITVSGRRPWALTLPQTAPSVAILTGSGVMLEPGSLIAKVPLGMLRQAGDHRTRQRSLPHVGERLGIDDIVPEAGPQHLEEVQPALRAGGREGGEVLVPELGADAVLVLVASTGIVDADPACRGQPGAQHLARLIEEGALALV